MRNRLNALRAAALQGELAEHAGLAYERLAPINPGEGKVEDSAATDWLRAFEKLGAPTGYALAFERWKRSFTSEGDLCVEVELTARLLVGHGNPSGHEVGLSLHHTWGVPMIPGSALKGLLNHYVDVVYGPSGERINPNDPTLTGEPKARAPYQGVTWRGTRIAHGPGEVHRALFGAPPADDDTHESWSTVSGPTQGAVTFHDAWWAPRGTREVLPLAADVLTVHQKPYYDTHGAAKSAPNDHESPIPVAFLTVRPGARFLVALSGAAGWTSFASDLLLEALELWGVGAKTAAGYGRARRGA